MTLDKSSFEEERLCETTDEAIYVFNDTAHMESNIQAVRKCKALGGNMKEPRNENEWKSLMKELKPHFDTCETDFFWIPIFKQHKNTIWFNQNRHLIEYAAWFTAQPNGGD